MEIRVSNFSSSKPYFFLYNEEGVKYLGNDLDELIRFFCGHTQQKATKIGTVGFGQNDILCP